MLACGTVQGLVAVSRHAGSKPAVLFQALEGHLVTHLVVAQDGCSIISAVPELGPVHRMLGDLAPDQGTVKAVPGVYITDSRAPGSTHRVWSGNARSVGVRGPERTTSAIPPCNELYVGTEPADVFVSSDNGAAWRSANGFTALPSRSKWSFPAPPHLPHVLSVEFIPGETSSVVAGVEVGGVLYSADHGQSWEERNNGLYTDVHSCRIDPHDSSKWWAVTGGGLYTTTDAGASWRQVLQGMRGAGRYPVGLALNPLNKGEMLVSEGDRPPAIGAHILHSLDGGVSFTDITERIYSAAPETKGQMTPVPYFWDGNALLGTDTGHIVISEDPERSSWNVAIDIGAPVVCMAASGQSPSSVMH